MDQNSLKLQDFGRGCSCGFFKVCRSSGDLRAASSCGALELNSFLLPVRSGILFSTFLWGKPSVTSISSAQAPGKGAVVKHPNLGPQGCFSDLLESCWTLGGGLLTVEVSLLVAYLQGGDMGAGYHCLSHSFAFFLRRPLHVFLLGKSPSPSFLVTQL